MKQSAHILQQAATDDASGKRGAPPSPGRSDEARGGTGRPVDDGSADSAARRAGSDRPREREDRTLSNRPQDPNRIGGGLNFPPGVDPADARDPGNQTPNAPPVDNRSGQKRERK